MNVHELQALPPQLVVDLRVSDVLTLVRDARADECERILNALPSVGDSVPTLFRAPANKLHAQARAWLRERAHRILRGEL